MRIEVQNLPTPEKNANRHQSDTRPKKMLKTINPNPTRHFHLVKLTRPVNIPPLSIIDLKIYIMAILCFLDLNKKGVIIDNLKF